MDFLKMLKEMADEVSEKRKVVKTIKIKKSWEPALKDLRDAQEEGNKILDELEKTRNKTETLKKAFWSRVEIDLNDFDSNMRVNREKNVIEIYEEDEE